MGHMPWSDFCFFYLEQKRLDKAEAQLIEEKNDLIFIFGGNHFPMELSIMMIAPIYNIQGRWEEAEKLEVQMMETSKTKLGADYPDTLTCMVNLASTYRNQGWWKEAEKLEVEVMQISNTKLGADHPKTLTSMANLATTFSKTHKTKLGADHPVTMMIMGNLASTFSRQGRWKEAEKLFLQFLARSMPPTLSSLAAVTDWIT
ncbi:TPR-12 multi-domain protein [Podospora fimiseda]|uniref:TPR-12 multi-domain protein n=1 Tax=Podospora fimiseda TaxID=252190 RepID=A0AAN7BE91_9PEZI|nr:TPR-12 multi-domain protein [Podospora fimiseda]